MGKVNEQLFIDVFRSRIIQFQGFQLVILSERCKTMGDSSRSCELTAYSSHSLLPCSARHSLHLSNGRPILLYCAKINLFLLSLLSLPLPTLCTEFSPQLKPPSPISSKGRLQGRIKCRRRRQVIIQRRIQQVRALLPFRMGREWSIHHCECASRH
jgi:hypothetical protein